MNSFLLTKQTIFLTLVQTLYWKFEESGNVRAFTGKRNFGCTPDKRKKAPSSLKYSTGYIWRQSDYLWSSLKMSLESLERHIHGLNGLMCLSLGNKLVILHPGSENNVVWCGKRMCCSFPGAENKRTSSSVWGGVGFFLQCLSCCHKKWCV